MGFLAPLAGLLGFEIESVIERVKRAVIGNAIMLVLALVGFVFLLAAGFFALTTAVGAIYAALIFAAVFLVLALAVYLGMQMAESKRRRLAVEKRRSSDTGAFMTTAAMTALPILLRSPIVRTIGLPAAAIAALFLFKGGRDD